MDRSCSTTAGDPQACIIDPFPIEPYPAPGWPYVQTHSATALTMWPPPLSDADIERIADRVVARLRAAPRTLTVFGQLAVVR
jgi:hypothetical protein